MKNILYIIGQCTWGCVQSAVGFLVFLANIRYRHFYYRGAVATEWDNSDYGLSLGLFIFVPEASAEHDADGQPDERLLVHEYGHTLQSLLLGPLYLLIVALPSCIWCMLPYFQGLRQRKGISYYEFYTEKWADCWGSVSDKV